MEKITIEDEYYPERLKNIENPPKILYLEGNKELLKTNIISIVGTRTCSQKGKELTQKFTKKLVKQNITIASGLAKGIDTIAHISTLQNKGKTIAVLGDGLNKIFPKENIDLYRKIIENNGLVISEYEPEEEADSQKFLERNRIVSGISLGILVVEAKYRSGTSVTAKIAKEQERKVFAIPQELGNKNGIGTNRLIKEGIATLVTNPNDILENIEELKHLAINENIENFKEKRKKRTKTSKNMKNKIVRSARTKKIQKYKKESKKLIFKEEYKEIYEIILYKTNNIDEIYKISKKSIGEVNRILLMLEVEGYIKKVAGGYICT